MQCFRPALGLLLGSLASALPARAEIEFTGVIVAAEKSMFALADPATSDTRWLTLGQSFSGWKIAGYDAANETLSLTKDSATKSLKLKGSTVQEAKPAPPFVTGDATFKIGGRTVSQSLAFSYGVTTEVSLGDGVTVQITPTLQPDGRAVLYKTSFKRSQGAVTETLASPSVSILPGNGFSLQVGDLSFGFDPKPAAAAKP